MCVMGSPKFSRSSRTAFFCEVSAWTPRHAEQLWNMAKTCGSQEYFSSTSIPFLVMVGKTDSRRHEDGIVTKIWSTFTPVDSSYEYFSTGRKVLDRDMCLVTGRSFGGVMRS